MVSERPEGPSGITSGRQGDLFGGASIYRGSRRKQMGFVDPDPRELFVHGVRLDEHLRGAGSEDVLKIREVLRALDWTSFRSQYDLGGRPPYAPEAMMGGIVYGWMIGRSSLRELERLFRFDLRVWWLTGGIKPDHAALGRFFKLHALLLTNEFFVAVTHQLLKELGREGRNTVTALDATVVAAAASRRSSCRVSKAVAAAERAQAEAVAKPESAKAQEAAATTQRLADVGSSRAAARKAAGEDVARTMVSMTEPDAAVLKSKSGRSEPGYLPSVLVNEDRIILGQCVEQTSEVAAFPKVLQQARQLAPEIETVVADGGYCRGEALQFAVEENLDFVSRPPRKASGQASSGPLDAPDRRIGKGDCSYSESSDHYVCPHRNVLKFDRIGMDPRRGTESRVYLPDKGRCADCPFKTRCGPKRHGIWQQASEPYLRAMASVVTQAQAKKHLRQRKAMVEPVFSVTRYVIGLRRFKRFGLASVQAEFALCAIAYNLLTMLRLRARQAGSRPGQPYQRSILLLERIIRLILLRVLLSTRA